MLFRFIIRLIVFGFIAAAASFWATSRYGQDSLVQGLVKTVTPVVAIRDLVQNPGKYEGSLVQVSGRPVTYTKVAALGLGGLLLEDESGNKIVILVKSGIPAADVGGVITVVGRFRNILEFGSFAYPVLLVG